MQTVTTTSRPKRPEVSTAPKPFYHHISLDVLILILSRSIFHPFICFLIPLCLLATHRPATSAGVVNTFYWACLVTLYHMVAIWNHRLAYGKARHVNLDDELVLIAGGGSDGGLGKLMAEVYAMKGVKGVAVLDVQVPAADEQEREEWEEMGVRWYECDVGNRDELERVSQEIEKEFDCHPSMVMNCIAAPISTEPISRLTTAQFTSALHANLTSHFNLISVFLPHIIADASKADGLTSGTDGVTGSAGSLFGRWRRAGTSRSSSNSNQDSPVDEDGTTTSPGGGTIITTSSVLGHLSPAHLCPYSSSKAAISSLHTSVTAEVSRLGLSHRIKTILLEPGQLNTGLFAPRTGPSTAGKASSSHPILNPSDLHSVLGQFLAPPVDTREMIKALSVLLDNGEGGIIRLPAYSAVIFGSGLWAALPVSAKKLARWLLGVDRVVVEAETATADESDPGLGQASGSADDLVVVDKE